MKQRKNRAVEKTAKKGVGEEEAEEVEEETEKDLLRMKTEVSTVNSVISFNV